MNHSYGLIAYREAGLDRILSFDYVDIGAANGGEANLDHHLSMTGSGNRQSELSGRPKDTGLHHASRRLPGLPFFDR